MKPISHTGYWTPDQLYTVVIEITIASILSSLGSLFILLQVYYFRKIALSRPIFHTHLRLVLYMSIADLGTSIISHIGNSLAFLFSALTRPTNEWCQIQAGLNQFFALSAALWTSAIAWSIHIIGKAVLDMKDTSHSSSTWFQDEIVRRINKQFPYYHLVCWGIPLLSVIYLSATGRFGTTNLWCWIDHHNMPFRFYFFIIPVVIIIIFNVIAFVRTHKMVRILTSLRPSGGDLELQLVRTLSLYVAAGVLCWSWGIANRLLDLVYHNESNKVRQIRWLYYLQAWFDPLQGFCNMVVFVMASSRMASHSSESRLLSFFFSKFCCLFTQDRSQTRSSAISVNSNLLDHGQVSSDIEPLSDQPILAYQADSYAMPTQSSQIFGSFQ